MLTLVDFFCGAGGSSQGAHAVPGVEVTAAANHWAMALESHALNFPDTVHYEGDIRDMDMRDFPPGDLFWASPECPKWSKARGRKRDYDNTAQGALEFEDLEPVTDEEAARSRALMVNVPDYLEAMKDRGRTVQAGVVENVTDCREWDRWDWWIGRIHDLGYKTRVIALNSMHARPVRTQPAPQSRNRLYVAYWLRSLGRDPDWDKWLRPIAHCPTCDQDVALLQVFKEPLKDMGDYGVQQGQYVYRCPRKSCRGRVIEPPALPALVAIDWSIPGTPIGSRKRTPAKPDGLAPATIARIRAGLERYAMPLVSPAGGTWRQDASPVTDPFPTRTTRENDGLAVPPLLIPTEGRADERSAKTVAQALRTQTARNQTGLAWLPFIAELRGGSSDARSVTEALATVTASGNHHGLVTPPGLPAMVVRNNGSKGDGGEHCTPVTEPMRTLTTTGHQSLVIWDHLLVPYNGNGTARQISEPVGTVTTRDRWSLVSSLTEIDILEVLFRMLEPHEIAAAMAFFKDYKVVGNKRQRVRQFGNAVTPNVAEVIVSALVEAITGEDLEVAA
jgi:DNA (cytosine-5)-methyltransferase 1